MSITVFFPALADWSEWNCPNFICSGALTVRVSDNRGFWGGRPYWQPSWQPYCLSPYHFKMLLLTTRWSWRGRPYWRPSWISLTAILAAILDFGFDFYNFLINSFCQNKSCYWLPNWTLVLHRNHFCVFYTVEIAQIWFPEFWSQIEAEWLIYIFSPIIILAFAGLGI